MDIERGIIVAGMIAAIIAMIAGPTVFALGYKAGRRSRRRRR